MSLRVLHVIPSLGSGGAERVLLTLLRGLSRLNIENRVCVLGSPNSFLERLPAGCYPTFCRYSGSWRNPSALTACLRAVRRTISDFPADVVHSHLWPAAQFSALAAFGLPAKQVVHIHDTRGWLSENSRRQKARRLLARWTVGQMCPTFIAVSEAVRAYTLRHLPWTSGRIHTVFNGLDESFFPADGQTDEALPRKQNGPLVIGAAGRLSPEKGHAVLLKAAAQLRDEGLSFKLRLAGDGALLSDLRQTAAHLNLQETVEFCGFLSDMDGFYRSLNLFVLPSTGMEGLPLVVLEAMAYGLPIVATDVPGSTDALRHQLDGLIVPPEDPVSLAQALRRLLHDHSLRWRLGQSAAARVRERFTADTMARGVAAVYDTVMGTARPFRR
jgi:glycosyltransferase involved in cell wall biosynthesis